MKRFPLSVTFSLPLWVQEGKILNSQLFSVKVTKDDEISVSRQVDYTYLCQLEKKVLSNSKQKTTEKIGMLQGGGSMNNMKEERGEM